MAYADDLDIQDFLNRDYDPLDDPDPICGNCGERSTFTEHTDYRMDSETGHVEGEWLTCDNCGAKTDQAELDNWQRTWLKPITARVQLPTRPDSQVA